MMRCAYLQFLYILIPLFLLAVIYQLFFKKVVIYRYSLASYIARARVQSFPYFRTLFFFLRILILGILAFLILKPQLPDRRSQINVEGIDIMLMLDCSGSMICFDDMQDRRSRMEIAKKEAVNFIEQRDTDAMGLVVFGNGALSACPLTHDKTILREIISALDIGTMVDERSTLLGHGMLAALNRLKKTNSSSKILIVLTDGQPSMNDVPIHVPLSIAQEMKVKIYTVGIGSDQGGYSVGPHGMMMSEGAQLNEQLLQHIADQSGGRFYRARNAQEMREIYRDINKIEKRTMPVNLYARYYDIFEPFLWLVIFLVMSELLLSLFVWKTL